MLARTLTITLVSSGLFALAASIGMAAQADDVLTIEMTLQNDVFTPAEIKAPAGKPFVLRVTNKDAVPAEIESKPLKIEKVAVGNSEIVAHIGPQKPGRYLVVNEYKEDTVKAYVVVE
jgi:heme/copper-type cytochrome/quinol oxidase subunit 2